MPPSPHVITKFGGTSVASVAGWQTIARVASRHLDAGLRPVVVCSAVAGVSDLLTTLMVTAVDGEPVEPALAEIEAKHLRLGEELGIDAALIVRPLLQRIEELARATRLIGEATPRCTAELMSHGELMSTRMGAAFLASQGLPVTWVDARTLLDSTVPPGSPDEARYLSATCQHAPRPELHDLLPEEGIALTQGFIARDPEGETVLLGRGGSDTSASYLAARLGARHLEIWTDVPGLFTTNPNDDDDARLLRRLPYDCAEMLAGLGGRVLHPRSLGPVRGAGIPLHVKSTYAPDLQGTIIERHAPDPGGPFAVTRRSGLAMITMERPPSWQPVGFLADVTACFARHQLSIDLIASSPTTIRATVDPSAAPHSQRVLDSVLADLSDVCDASVRTGVGSVSLVGTDTEPVLHSPDEVHMTCHAADSSHVTVVLDGEAAAAAAHDLHRELFAERVAGPLYGPTWAELTTSASGPSPRRTEAA